MSADGVNPFKAGRGSIGRGSSAGSAGSDGGQSRVPRGYRLSRASRPMDEGGQSPASRQDASSAVVPLPAVHVPSPGQEPVQAACTDSLPVPVSVDGSLPAWPGEQAMWGSGQYAAAPAPANRPDWSQAPAPSPRPNRGLMARSSRVRRPGSEGIGARSTMEMMYRESAQSRFQGRPPADGRPVTDVDYEFRQDVSAGLQLSASPVDDGFDSLDEFVDLSKPSKFKRGRGKANMLKGHGQPRSTRSPARGGAGGKMGRPTSVARQAATAGAAMSGDSGFDAPARGVSMITAVKLFYRKYARFAGRASKSEYWWIMLFVLLASIVLTLVPMVGPFLLAVFMLGSLVPSLALVWRRAHDSDKPWLPWLYVGSIVLSGALAAMAAASSISALSTGRMDMSMLGGMSLAGGLLGLLSFVLFIVIGVLPSKPSGVRFDKK